MPPAPAQRRARSGRRQLRFQLRVLRLQLADILDRQLKSPLQIGDLLLDVWIDLNGRLLLELFNAGRSASLRHAATSSVESA